jgi:ATP-dependent DNA helicase RecQ
LAQLQGTRKTHVLLKWGTLSRWFRRRYRRTVDEPIEQPYRALLARFILGCEAAAPGSPHVVGELIESLYEFRAGDSPGASGSRHAPLLLLTAHRAKGLEFDHVVILDAGGWLAANDSERRLYYVAMTRARKTLTLCARQGCRHPFVMDCEDLCLKSRPITNSEVQPPDERVWLADPAQVVLSWPGYYAPQSPIHRAAAELDYGSPLTLRARSDGKPGWELADLNGVTVARMARAFTPPEGEIVEVRVSAILARQKKPGDPEALRCSRWEVVLPEIRYLSSRPASTKMDEAVDLLNH